VGAQSFVIELFPFRFFPGLPGAADQRFLTQGHSATFGQMSSPGVKVGPVYQEFSGLDSVVCIPERVPPPLTGGARLKPLLENWYLPILLTFLLFQVVV
jgi:hypothetical protein